MAIAEKPRAGASPPASEGMDGPGSGRSEWARGWPIVAAGVIGMICATISLGAIGVVMQPLHARFGWNRAQVSGALLVCCLCVTVVSPLMGLVMQRFGVRRVGLVGFALYMTALAGISLAGPGLWSWYAAWMIFGLVTPTASTVVWTVGIGRRFNRHRGMAFALVGAGGGIGIFLSPLVAAALLPLAGWRGIFVGLGAGCLLVGWPLIWLLFRPDEEPRRGRSAVGTAGPGTTWPEPAPLPAPVAGYAPAQVLGSLRYWFLVIASALVGFAVGGMTVHLLPIMHDAGLTLWQAARYVSLIGPASVLGNLLAGWLLDRAPVRLVTTGCFAAPMVACAILLDYHGSALQSAASAILLGAASGIEANVLAFLVLRFYGLRAYGTAFGLLIGILSLAFGAAPVIAGAVFDRTGSYHPILLVWLVGLAASVVLAQFLGRPGAAPAVAAVPAAAAG